MLNALRAEFRKVATTSLWWALLIPSAALALMAALFMGWLGDLGADLVENAAARAPGQSDAGNYDGPIPWGLFVFSRAINIAAVFPLVLGALAASGEYSRKSITITFLTSPNRMTALGAKMLNHAGWGALYGVTIVVGVSAGLALTVEPQALPQAGAWLAMTGVGILASMLMAAFGVAAGAVIRNAPATLVVLLLYFLLIENALLYTLLGNDLDAIVGFLPNASINGITGSLATDLFLSTVPLWGQQITVTPTITPDIEAAVQTVAGAQGAFEWWLSALIFLGWTALFFGGAWALTRRRDIT